MHSVYPTVHEEFSGTTKPQSFPTQTPRWTRCSIIVERSLTEINLRRANGRSPPAPSALIDWHRVLSGAQQSWNNYSNLHVEWSWGEWCSAPIRPSKARAGEVYDGMPMLHGDWRYRSRRRNVCSYQIFSFWRQRSETQVFKGRSSELIFVGNI